MNGFSTRSLGATAASPLCMNEWNKT